MAGWKLGAERKGEMPGHLLALESSVAVGVETDDCLPKGRGISFEIG